MYPSIETEFTFIWNIDWTHSSIHYISEQVLTAIKGLDANLFNENS